MTISPETNIEVTLTAGQWNLVLGQLSEGPYRLVAPILQAIQQQCMNHDPDRQLTGGPPFRPINGDGDYAERGC